MTAFIFGASIGHTPDRELDENQAYWEKGEKKCMGNNQNPCE
jgi:hypothetical protein